MINIMEDKGKVAYNVQTYALDFTSDVEDLPTKTECAPGSVAFVIEDGSIYMKNSRGEWKEI